MTRSNNLLTSPTLWVITISLFLIGCQNKKEDVKPSEEAKGDKVAQVRTLYATQGNAPTVGAMYPRVISRMETNRIWIFNTQNSIFPKILSEK